MDNEALKQGIANTNGYYWFFNNLFISRESCCTVNRHQVWMDETSKTKTESLN